MDPIAALEMWLADKDPHVRRDLNDWIDRGGFRPRVQLSPATDAWMAGDRYGEVLHVTPTFVLVKCDQSGLNRLVVPGLVSVVR